MKKIVYLSLLLLFVISCSEEKKKLDLVEQGSTLSAQSKDTCLCNELEIDSLTQTFLKNNEPFTGVCIHNYPHTAQKYMIKNILEGKLHGKTSYFDQQGELLVEEVYENGTKKRSGANAPIDCECSELKHNNTTNLWYLDNIPFTGRCFEKYPDSDKTYLEVPYVNGMKEGFTVFYDRFGATMYMEKYEKGNLVKTIYETKK